MKDKKEKSLFNQAKETGKSWMDKLSKKETNSTLSAITGRVSAKLGPKIQIIAKNFEKKKFIEE